MMIENFKNNFLIADDHSIVRQGFIYIIKERRKDAQIFEAKSLEEIKKCLSENIIDFLILDLNFPEGTSLSLISEIKENWPLVKILIFTAHDEDLYAIRCFNAGADGYLSKACYEEEMIEAYTEIVQNGKYVSKKVRDIIFNSYISNTSKNPLDSLTNKELEIALLYIKGQGNLEICNSLNIKKSTVSTFKSKIFEKLGVTNIPSLVEIFKLYYKNN